MTKTASPRSGPVWFIYKENIAHYRERLAVETDPQTTATLRRLLAEEEDKLAEYNAKNPQPKGSK